jgi:dUTP pyrophosphatase
MKIILDKGAKMPTKAHSTDAGYDLYARDSQIICAKESATIDTGVHIELPVGTVGFIKSRSGLMFKHEIVAGEGVIDVGFNGSIGVKLFNLGGRDYKVNAGDKICQLVILKLADVGELEVVEHFEETERGSNGFGSSGR